MGELHGLPLPDPAPSPSPDFHTHRLKLIRVICTDPHATDSSSSSEDDSDDILHRYPSSTFHVHHHYSSNTFHVRPTSKRFVHHIPLPFPPPPASPSSSSTASSSSMALSPLHLHHHHPHIYFSSSRSRRPASRSSISRRSSAAPRRPIASKRKARKKIVSFKFLDAPQTTPASPQQEFGIHLANNSKRPPSFSSYDPIQGLQPQECEEFAGDSLTKERLQHPCHFLSDEDYSHGAFVSAGMNFGHDSEDTSMKPDHVFSEIIKDLELDSEAMTWLDSLQNLA